MELPAPLHIPRQVRAAIYWLVAFGSLLMGYLDHKTVMIGTEETALWFGFCSLAAMMAGFNLTPPGIAAPPLDRPVPEEAPPTGVDGQHHNENDRGLRPVRFENEVNDV